MSRNPHYLYFYVVEEHVKDLNKCYTHVCSFYIEKKKETELIKLSAILH